MVRTVDVTGSKPIRIPTKTVKISLHSQPHCATATGFHDYLSIVSGETRSQTFQNMQFQNSNNGFCNRRGARVESKEKSTSRPFCDSLKFEISTFSNGEQSACVHRCRIRSLFWAARRGACGRLAGETRSSGPGMPQLLSDPNSVVLRPPYPTSRAPAQCLLLLHPPAPR